MEKKWKESVSDLIDKSNRIFVMVLDNFVKTNERAARWLLRDSRESDLSWIIDEDGDLVIEVKRRTVQKNAKMDGPVNPGEPVNDDDDHTDSGWDKADTPRGERPSRRHPGAGQQGGTPNGKY